jgi:hypothetical protein
MIISSITYRKTKKKYFTFFPKVREKNELFMMISLFNRLYLVEFEKELRDYEMEHIKTNKRHLPIIQNKREPESDGQILEIMIKS